MHIVMAGGISTRTFLKLKRLTNLTTKSQSTSIVDIMSVRSFQGLQSYPKSSIILELQFCSLGLFQHVNNGILN